MFKLQNKGEHLILFEEIQMYILSCGSYHYYNEVNFENFCLLSPWKRNDRNVYMYVKIFSQMYIHIFIKVPIFSTSRGMLEALYMYGGFIINMNFLLYWWGRHICTPFTRYGGFFIYFIYNFFVFCKLLVLCILAIFTFGWLVGW